MVRSSGGGIYQKALGHGRAVVLLMVGTFPSLFFSLFLFVMKETVYLIKCSLPLLYDILAGILTTVLVACLLLMGTDETMSQN